MASVLERLEINLSACCMEASMLAIKAVTSVLRLAEVPCNEPIARAFRLCFRERTWSPKAVSTGVSYASVRFMAFSQVAWRVFTSCSRAGLRFLRPAFCMLSISVCHSAKRSLLTLVDGFDLC